MSPIKSPLERLEDRVEKNDVRITSLEHWRTFLLGCWLIVGALGAWVVTSAQGAVFEELKAIHRVVEQQRKLP